ncbi:hypothetical protein HK097_006041 [Rhizophlyctis rosea]|uniref:Uncharacterized protein n=1 Tax=Rhizophlyctis rosea TaxID=64517 RepID=A0AAD5SDL0_9FUNG|nr:hypothetical protein HK097_006041 [Rhizophlyctis rosea]
MENSEQMEDEQPVPAKKSAKGRMTETKLANLERARMVRKANLEAKKKKYPQDKRSIIDRKLAEEEELERRIAAEAEKKAQDILDKKRLEQDLAELQELRKWKQQQQKQKQDEEEVTSKSTKKKAPVTKETKETKTKPKAAPKRKKKVSIQEEETDNSETDCYGASRTQSGRGTRRTAVSSDSTSNNYDWLDDVLG